MVVLDHKTATAAASSAHPPTSLPTGMALPSYLQSPYLQPLPSEGSESKISPLAMLTQACNKIESNMMGSASGGGGKKATAPSGSPKRPRSIDQGSPVAKAPRVTSTSPLDYKVRLPTEPAQVSPSQSVKRSTPTERRPSSASASSLSSTSPTLTAAAASSSVSTLSPRTTAPAAGTTNPYPVYSPVMPSVLPPGFPRPPGLGQPCTDPMCRDPTCPTVALRNAHAAAMLGFHSPYMYPPTAAAGLGAPPSSLGLGPPTSPYVCNWMSNGDFCGRRFSSSEDLMGHLRTHTSSNAATSAPSPQASVSSTSPTSSSTSVNSAPPAVVSTHALAALQAAQAQALYTPASSTASALAALHAQAAKAAGAAAPPTTVSNAADSALAAAAAAASRYHPYIRPGFPPTSPFGLAGHHPALPPHLASAYGLPSPYAMQLLYPLP